MAEVSWAVINVARCVRASLEAFSGGGANEVIVGPEG
jgi:hypothetical protein